MKTVKIGGALVAFAFLTGCQQEMVKPDIQSDPVLVGIHQAISHIEEQHSTLAAIERGENPAPPTPVKPESVNEFSEVITLRNWNGPVKEALEVLSGLIDYEFTESGRIPAIAPIVIFDADNEEFFDIITKINDQSSGRFTIRIDVSEQTLTLVHREG